MMSNNLATNLHLMVSIWKFETKLLTWETFQREMNPIGQLLWKNLKPHFSKLLNFLFVYSLVMLLYIAVNILKLFHIADMFDCPSTNLYKFQSLFEAIFYSVWVPGWSRMNYCKNTELIQCLSSIHSLFQPGLAQNCTFDQVQYELVSKPWTDPNLISYLVLVCNIWWSFSPGLVQFELVLNPWSGPM